MRSQGNRRKLGALSRRLLLQQFKRPLIRFPSKILGENTRENRISRPNTGEERHARAQFQIIGSCSIDHGRLMVRSRRECK